MDHGPIIGRLRHYAQFEYRYQLEDALASLWPHTSTTAAAAALSKALSDDDSDVRLLAIEILSKLGTKAESALPAMIRALNDEHRLVRIAAVEPVAAFGLKVIDAIPILESWSHSPTTISAESLP